MNPGTLEADAGSPSLLLLDDPSCWPSFGRALAMGGKDERSAPARWESHVVFQGMRCAGCALAVERALRAVRGVLEVRVGAASQRGLVVWSPALTKPSDWLRAVRRAGYGVVPAQDGLARVEQQRDTRAALWRWLVAGFCMMQVMMYAIPAYLADPGELGSDSSQLLRWASWVLTLPVMCFSASPFFSHAWNDLLRRRISMDLPDALGILITLIPAIRRYSMWKRRIMTVVWPAFLVAGVLEMLAFFVFWAVTCVSSALTMLLGLSSAEVNEGTGAGGGANAN